MTISKNIHLLRPVFTKQGHTYYTQSPRSGSFIFKMAAMLQIPRVFPRVPRLGSAKAVQCPRPGPKIGDKSQQIPRLSPVCPWGQPPGIAEVHKHGAILYNETVVFSLSITNPNGLRLIHSSLISASWQDSAFVPVFCGWEINMKTKIRKKYKQTVKAIYFIYGNMVILQSAI